MVKEVTIYPTFIPNPLLADVQHNYRLNTFVAVDNHSRQVITQDILLSFLLDKPELKDCFVGIDPSTINYRTFVNRDVKDPVDPWPPTNKEII